MAPHGNETSYELRVLVDTCRLLYFEEFEAIERGPGVKARTAAGITRRAIDRAENKEFNDVLACLCDANRPGAPARTEDRLGLLKTVRQAIIKHPRAPCLEAV